MNKIYLLIFLFFFFSSTLIANPNIKARTTILVDYHSDEILYESDPDAQIYPASMTKIMTAIVAFDLLKKINYLLMMNLLYQKMLGDSPKQVIRLCSL